MTMKDLLSAALKLPDEEYEELVDSLLSRMDPVPAEAVSQAWVDEVSRRSEDIHAGRVATIPAAEVLKAARARLKRAD